MSTLAVIDIRRNVVLTVRAEIFDGQVILHCEGRLVRGDEIKLLCAALRQDRDQFIVDLREVTAVDAAGVGALVSLQAAGVYLTLVDPTPTVREVLSRTNLDSIFEIIESRSRLWAAETGRAESAVA